MPRILIVDDDPALRTAVRKILAEAGYEADEAADGAEALERCRVDPPDLVLLDVYMPNVEGVEVLVRLTAEHLGVPVVAISGGGWIKGNDALRIMSDLGAERTLAKPFERDELLAVVRTVLHREREPGREAEA